MSEIRNLEELLSTHFGATYEILDHSTTNLTALGDNYGSTILALSVKLRNKLTKDEETVELVAKMAPKDPMFFNLFQVPVSFPKEASMYTSVARALKDHQEKHSVPEDLYLDCFCECFGVRRNLTGSEIVDMDAVLVLENLKPKGFACGSRSQGFNKIDTEFIVRRLARFHAVPIAMQFVAPEVFEKEVMPSLNKMNMGEGFSEQMTNELFEFMENTIVSIPEIAPLRDLLMKQIKEGKVFFELGDVNRKSVYNTICHNDFWVNNMMLRWDGQGVPQEIRIVDYQTTHYNTAVTDLIFFLFTSVRNEVLEENLEEFFRLYFDEFQRCLQANGCPLKDFTYESFMEEVDEMAKLELQHILMMTKILHIESNKIEGATNLSVDVIASSDLIGPDYYAKFKLVILLFQQRKWLME